MNRCEKAPLLLAPPLPPSGVRALHHGPSALRTSLRFPEFHPLLHTANWGQTVGRRQTDRRLPKGITCIIASFFYFSPPFAPPILYNFPHLYVYNIYHFIIKITLYVFLNLTALAAVLRADGSVGAMCGKMQITEAARRAELRA